MAEQGFLTAVNEDYIGESADNFIELGPFWETIDGPAIKLLIRTIDNNVLQGLIDRNPSLEQVVPHVNALLDAARSGDLNTVENEAAAILNIYVDVPGIEEDDEALYFESIIKMIVAFVRSRIRKETQPPHGDTGDEDSDD